MDNRKEVLKSLKKERKMARREHYTRWKALAILVLVISLVCALTVAVGELQDAEPFSLGIEKALELLRQAETELGLDLSGARLWWQDGRIGIICSVAALVCFVLFVVFAVLWSRGKRKWKRSDAYLDYRTMKVTLKAEKLAAKGK